MWSKGCTSAELNGKAAEHGEGNPTPASVSGMCALKGVLCTEPPGPQSSGQGFECLQGPWDPKGGELYRPTAKPWETVVEAGRCSDVQIV